MRWGRLARSLVVAVAIFGAVGTFAPEDALGRPGGGQGYSGGSGRSGGSTSPSRPSSPSPGGGSGYSSHGSSSPSSSSSSPSSSSSDDDGLGRAIGELIWMLILLAIQHPAIGLPILGVIVLLVVLRRVWSPIQDWAEDRIDRYAADAPASDRGADPLASVLRAQRERQVDLPEVREVGLADAIEQLRAVDGNFSLVIFEDFLAMLYSRVHDARGKGTLEEVGAYVTPEAQRALRDRTACTGVEAVVLGAMSVVRFRGTDRESPRVEVDVRIEANLTERGSAGERRGVFVVETWTLARAARVASRPPERARTFDCPGCGAPLTSRDVNTNRCLSCGQLPIPVESDWGLVRVTLEEETTVPPALTTHVEERGTDAPTQVASGADARLAELGRRDAGFSWEAFDARVRHAYDAINAGWSEGDWSRARPFVSDAFHRSQLYWLAAYREAGLRNRVEAARLGELTLADARSDRFYDAVTVRIFAEALDFTVRDGTDELVSGSRSAPRRYSEYWTFVRSAEAKPTERPAKACPNCGAPLELEMTGECRHCRAHVTSGEFDWVLSRIEQDESYGA